MDTSEALYIKFKGREWITWTTPDDTLMAIPGDEQEYGEVDLIALRTYLFQEGFFHEFFQSKLDILDKM